eukprot:3801788-Amphidinium_carterae.1
MRSRIQWPFEVGTTPMPLTLKPKPLAKAWGNECWAAGGAPTASEQANTLESFPHILANDTGKQPMCMTHVRWGQRSHGDLGCMLLARHLHFAKSPGTQVHQTVESPASEPKCPTPHSVVHTVAQ